MFNLGGQRKKYRLTDVVSQYCNKRDECSCSSCPFGSIRGKGVTKEDIAYTEGYHCPKYRPKDGGTAGADIVETGVWK